MSSHEVRPSPQPNARPALDVSEYCRRAGIGEAEERRLITLLGRYASRHELQMNLRWPLRAR
ncbi:hypothetical protein [Ensifer sp.]|uniref:hypothetical protein n=1 Tax=Ensifer sp. TaxID=1872086 RepID=UPI002E157389|nr:hypothetical protein [Ensifer sp.]